MSVTHDTLNAVSLIFTTRTSRIVGAGVVEAAGTDHTLTAAGDMIRPDRVSSPSNPPPKPQQYAVPPDPSPQVCNSPATRLVNVLPPVTATGVVRSVEEPSPSWAPPLYPQQYEAPPSTSPHAWRDPDTRLVKANPPDTVTGEVRVVVVPSPSWPCPLNPQQNVAPDVARAHV